MMHLLLSLSTSKAKLEEEWQEVNGEGLGMRRIHERNSDEEVREQCNSSNSGSGLLSSPPPEGMQILLQAKTLRGKL